MITLDLSILNQKGTPMFNSDLFANRPAAGIVGRIFISIDTAAIYRDTGTAWDLIADGASSSTNIYNSNGTLSANRVVSDGGFGLSFTPTTHIGTASIGGGGSGKLIVGSSTADNGIQIFGANSPSLRIDNSQSGGTQRFVFGLATATNNFIQGATAGQFCISTQSAGNMLFGMWQSTNASEVMRITTSNNLLIGSTNDAGFKLDVNGTARVSDNFIVSKNQNATTSLTVSNTTAGTSSYTELILQQDASAGLGAVGKMSSISNPSGIITSNNTYLYNGTAGDIAIYNAFATGKIKFSAGAVSTAQMTLTAAGRLLLGTTTESTYLLDLLGNARFRKIDNAAGEFVSFVANGLTAGIGIGWDGIYATGTNANGNIKLEAKGSGEIQTSSKVTFTGETTLVNVNVNGNSINSTNSRLLINYFSSVGGGSSQFRNTEICDGKNVIFSVFDATNKTFSINKATAADTSSVLEVVSTTKGFLPPRMTTTEKNAIGSPAAGLVVYDTTLNKLCVRTAATWETITSL